MKKTEQCYVNGMRRKTMIEELSIEDTANYSVEQLFDSSDNLKLDEKQGIARTYLIKDTVSRELAGYFSLRTGLLTIQAFGNKFNALPAAEL